MKGRNFALNPGQGLKISAYKNARDPASLADRELQKLARYMVLISRITDLRSINHKVSITSKYGELYANIERRIGRRLLVV